jgi:hypothetical protein
MSLRLQAEEMNRNLAGPTPTSLEQVLVDRLVAAWLGTQYMELSVASGQDNGLRVVEVRMKQLDSAHRRFLTAAKALATVRRLQQGLKIEILHRGDAHQAPGAPAAAGNRAGDVLGSNTLGGRLTEMMADATRSETQAMAGV